MNWMIVIGGVLCGWAFLSVIGSERHRRIGEILWEIEKAKRIAKAEEEEAAKLAEKAEGEKKKLRR